MIVCPALVWVFFKKMFVWSSACQAAVPAFCLDFIHASSQSLNSFLSSFLSFCIWTKPHNQKVGHKPLYGSPAVFFRLVSKASVSCHFEALCRVEPKALTQNTYLSDGISTEELPGSLRSSLWMLSVLFFIYQDQRSSDPDHGFCPVEVVPGFIIVSMWNLKLFPFSSSWWPWMMLDGVVRLAVFQ